MKIRSKDRKAVSQGLREIKEWEQGKRTLGTRIVKLSIPLIANDPQAKKAGEKRKIR